MVPEFVKEKNHKWLSSRLNISLNHNPPKLLSEKTKMKPKWLSSRLNINSKPSSPETPLTDKMQTELIETGLKYLLKDIQMPVSSESSSSRPEGENKLCSPIIENRKQKVKVPRKKCKSYSCSQCHFKSFNDKNLVDHCLIVHNTKIESNIKIRCHFCGLRVRKDIYKMHKSTHLESCKKCDFRGFRLVKHMRFHEQAKCPNCGKDFVNLSKLLIHQKSVHDIFDEGIYVHKCDLCKTGTRTLNLLKKHKIQFHDRNLLNCTKCDFEAPTAKQMRIHRSTHNIKYVSCLLCDFKSTFEKAVDTHRLRVHVGYTCEKCDTKFTSTTALNSHKLDHDKLECVECKFAAGTQSKLLTHSMAIHEGIKCTLCDIRFTEFRELNRHKHKHKELECKLCNFIAKFRTDFVSHMRKEHIQRLRKSSKVELEGFSEQLKACGSEHQQLIVSKVEEHLLDKAEGIRKMVETDKNTPITFVKKVDTKSNLDKFRNEIEIALFEFGCDI